MRLLTLYLVTGKTRVLGLLYYEAYMNIQTVLELTENFETKPLGLGLIPSSIAVYYGGCTLCKSPVLVTSVTKHCH